MKVFLIIYDTSNTGIDVEHFTSKADRDAACLAWCVSRWKTKLDGPMPTDWRDAYDVITDTDDDLMYLEEIDIDPLEIVKAAPAAMETCLGELSANRRIVE
jgi:hypothetical protein